MVAQSDQKSVYYCETKNMPISFMIIRTNNKPSPW